LNKSWFNSILQVSNKALKILNHNSPHIKIQITWAHVMEHLKPKTKKLSSH